MEKSVAVNWTAAYDEVSMENKKTETETPTRQNKTYSYSNTFYYKNHQLNNAKHLSNRNRWRTLSQPPWRNKYNPPTIKTTTTTITPPHINISCWSYINIIQRLIRQMADVLTKQHLWLILWFLFTFIYHVQSYEMTTSGTLQTKGTVTSANSLYSQLLSTNGQISMHDNKESSKEDDTFHPFVPKDADMRARNVFTPSGKFRVFQPIDTDLRLNVFKQQKNQHYNRQTSKLSQPLSLTLYPEQNEKNSKANVVTHEETIVNQTDSNNLLHMRQKPKHKIEHHKQDNNRRLPVKHEHKLKRDYQVEHGNMDDGVKQSKITKQNELTRDLKSLEDLLVEYVTNFLEKGHYRPMDGLLVELKKHNHSQVVTNKTSGIKQNWATDAEVKIDLPRSLQTGRLLFLTGLKKVLWPVFMGLQVLKSILIAMFIPAIIGSFTKLLGKGITTGSAPLFIRPMEPPQELDFRDNTLAFDDDNKFLITDEAIKGPYAYNQPDGSLMHNNYMFDPSSINNQLSYTRLGMNERQHQLMQDSYMNALQSIGSASFKNSGSLSSGSSGLLAPMAKKPPPAANINNFQQFQNVPDSSLLLSNYDPFYSPLLSRLDSVFAQLKINSDKEMCREKLICLMYANPAKYAPYSNLVSAQLSRELNELRKPTSDNPDILRFFKYMRAAKDGQDGLDCEQTFDKCTELKDFDNPAMLSSYHDINKLVQARKLTSK